VADDLEARLTAAAAALREREITAQRCEELERRLDETNRRLASLQTEYAAEHRDVERLEGISLTRVLASLRGARDDRLAQERAQADAVALRVQDVATRLAALQRDWSVRGRIQEAQHNVANCLGLVEQAHARLEQSFAAARARLDAIETERRGLLTREDAP
jgi:chromosome segregation ATPase